MEMCCNPIRDTSKFATVAKKRCYEEKGHKGKCEEFPYLKHLVKVSPQVANKIKRDATKTTGASWSSEEAGPNRMDRWGMLLSDAELLQYGVKMAALKPAVVNKLREKAACYEDCMDVAAKLTWLVYQMQNAPAPPVDIKTYLEARFGKVIKDSTKCLICRDHIDYGLFSLARRGRAELETAHSNPRAHNANNVGFAHRECNIAQGNKSLDEFYSWIAEILGGVGK